MFKNGRELLAPGYMDCDACMEREEDKGRDDELGGDLDIYVAFAWEGGCCCRMAMCLRACVSLEEDVLSKLQTGNSLCPALDGISYDKPFFGQWYVQIGTSES